MATEWKNAFDSLAPAPSQPGQGAGGIPYAAGLMQGSQNRPQGISGLFDKIRQSQGLTQARQQMSDGLSLPTENMPPPQPQQPQPIQWTPEIQQHIMDYLMSMLKSTRRGDHTTTTGGVVPRY